MVTCVSISTLKEEQEPKIKLLSQDLMDSSETTKEVAPWTFKISTATIKRVQSAMAKLPTDETWLTTATNNRNRTSFNIFSQLSKLKIKIILRAPMEMEAIQTIIFLCPDQWGSQWWTDNRTQIIRVKWFTRIWQLSSKRYLIWIIILTVSPIWDLDNMLQWRWASTRIKLVL